MDNTVQVSVHCLAYNHEKYIRKTLEGFVNQKTNFRFKVIIHEDASTDSTAEIIREYEEKYPDLFDVIYQKENQYSTGKDFVAEYMYPKTEGKYLAFCEGDDYWCDEHKLQKQYDIMEQNPDIVLCLHRVGLVSESGEPLEGTYPVSKINSGYLSSEQFIDYVCSDFFQLSSFFYRTEAEYAYNRENPAFVREMNVGDIPLTLYLGTRAKKMYFYDEIMSCYRVNSMSSVMRDTWSNKEKLRKHYAEVVNMINSFDQYTEGRYHASCMNFKEMKIFESYAKQKDIIAILKHPSCWHRFFRLPIRAQASIAVKGAFLAIRDKVREK